MADKISDRPGDATLYDPGLQQSCDAVGPQPVVQAEAISEEVVLTPGADWELTESQIVKVGRIVVGTFRARSLTGTGNFAALATLPVGMRPATNVLFQSGNVVDDSAVLSFLAQFGALAAGTITTLGYDNGVSLVPLFAIGANDSVRVNLAFVVAP